MYLQLLSTYMKTYNYSYTCEHTYNYTSKRTYIQLLSTYVHTYSYFQHTYIHTIYTIHIATLYIIHWHSPYIKLHYPTHIQSHTFIHSYKFTVQCLVYNFTLLHPAIFYAWTYITNDENLWKNIKMDLNLKKYEYICVY